MYASFYTAAAGAAAQQARMDVTANNLANVNTSGFKPKNAVFSQLLYYNLHAERDSQTSLRAGAGSKVMNTATDFEEMGLEQTNGRWDYGIRGNGFFRLQNPVTGEITYTRNGHFSLSQREDGFYLVADSGNLVTDAQGQPIRAENGEPSAEPGIYSFYMQSRLMNVGENEFVQPEGEAQPYINTQAELERNTLESSGTDMITEMTRMMESQRAYSYALKMLQTSDEVTGTINSLKQ